MIIHGKVFKRIKKIAETKKDYEYILLYFMENEIEIIFSNTHDDILKYLIEHFPLLIIYNKQRYEDMVNVELLDNLCERVLSRRISDTNKDLVLSSFESIDYDFLINEKDIAIQQINKVLILNRVLESFEKLNINFLTKGNLTSIKKRTKLPSNEYMNPSGTDESFTVYNFIAGLMKKNINKVLKDNNVLELKSYFYHPKLKKELNKSEKEDLKNETNFFTSQDKIDLFNLIDDKELSKKSIEIYNEIINEVKYINLYEYDYDSEYVTYEYLYDSLYSSMTYNKITALSTNYIKGDYLEQLYEEKMHNDCYDIVSDKMRKYYGFEFDSYSDEEIREYTMSEMGIDENTMYLNGANYSEAKMLDSYIDDYKIIIQEEADKLLEECMDEIREDTIESLQKYEKTLKVGEVKHRKS